VVQGNEKWCRIISCGFIGTTVVRRNPTLGRSSDQTVVSSQRAGSSILMIHTSLGTLCTSIGFCDLETGRYCVTSCDVKTSTQCQSSRRCICLVSGLLHPSHHGHNPGFLLPTMGRWGPGREVGHSIKLGKSHLPERSHPVSTRSDRIRRQEQEPSILGPDS